MKTRMRDMSPNTGRTRVALEQVEVVDNVPTAPSFFVMTLLAPRCARLCEPAQFVELKVPGDPAELLRLPFSVYRTDTEAGRVSILYQVVGDGTRRMAAMRPGDRTDLLGPIGRGWHPPEGARRALLVSGGTGAAPLVVLAERLAESGASVDVCMGAQTSGRLVARDDLAASGTLHVATDDGSEGHAGFCTDLSADLLDSRPFDYVATCGPYPMERIVAAQAAAHDVVCEASLETMMACGIGVCLGCVVDTTEGKRRVCVDGPVFDARKVVWR
ncbi:MAG: dihydroorotate dehydrogenase electron transfer subunit [Coriobacteriales bacterium]